MGFDCFRFKIHVFSILVGVLLIGLRVEEFYDNLFLWSAETFVDTVLFIEMVE